MKDTVAYIMLNRSTYHCYPGRTRPHGTAGRLGHRVDASPGEGLRDWQCAGHGVGSCRTGPRKATGGHDHHAIKILDRLLRCAIV